MPGLRVIEIFDSLQGEGFWTGTPMTFVRLAGCNAADLGLTCIRWCDTPGSWAEGSNGGVGPGAAAEPHAAREPDDTLDPIAILDPAAILDRVSLPRLCLTGGEPLLQPEGVVALVTAAHARAIRVHLETNGTIPPPGAGEWQVGAGDRRRETSEAPGIEVDDLFDWAVVSPKPPCYLIDALWDDLVDELKLIVDDQLDTATAERLAARHPEAVVSIQPLWERWAVSAQCGCSMTPFAARAVRLVLEHPDWRLSLQAHKYLGLR